MSPRRLCRQIEFRSKDYDAAIALRQVTLRDPLGLTWTEEEIAQEAHCHHLGCFQDERLDGTLVLAPLDSTTVRMRQVAVPVEMQRQGIGKALVNFAEDFAREHGYRRITAHARELAVPFYRKLGYAVEGERFVEVSIPHFTITKAL